MGQFNLKQIQISAHYGLSDFHDDLKDAMMMAAAVSGDGEVQAVSMSAVVSPSVKAALLQSFSSTTRRFPMRLSLKICPIYSTLARCQTCWVRKM